jgi:hypothetical protein
MKFAQNLFSLWSINENPPLSPMTFQNNIPFVTTINPDLVACRILDAADFPNLNVSRSISFPHPHLALVGKQISKITEPPNPPDCELYTERQVLACLIRPGAEGPPGGCHSGVDMHGISRDRVKRVRKCNATEMHPAPVLYSRNLHRVPKFYCVGSNRGTASRVPIKNS